MDKDITGIQNGKVTKIMVNGFGNCEFCGEHKELRPYGPKGEYVCFKCAMKDEEAAGKQYLKRLEGVQQGIIVVEGKEHE